MKVKKATVHNLRDGGFGNHPDDVKVDRSTRYGNPFKLLPDGSSVLHVIHRYDTWFHQHPLLMARAATELKYKRLWCWCSSPENPQPCHAHVIADYVNNDKTGTSLQRKQS